MGGVFGNRFFFEEGQTSLWMKGSGNIFGVGLILILGFFSQLTDGAAAAGPGSKTEEC